VGEVQAQAPVLVPVLVDQLEVQVQEPGVAQLCVYCEEERLKQLQRLRRALPEMCTNWKWAWRDSVDLVTAGKLPRNAEERIILQASGEEKSRDSSVVPSRCRYNLLDVH
jgi:hypothetical protein